MGARPEHARVEEKLGGSGWVAERGAGWATVSHPTGKWNEGEITFAITDEEFETLRADPDAIGALCERYDSARGDRWWARRDARCWVVLQDEGIRFHLPNDAFERLRDEPGLIDEIRAQYQESGRFDP